MSPITCLIFPYKSVYSSVWAKIIGTTKNYSSYVLFRYCVCTEAFPWIQLIKTGYQSVSKSNLPIVCKRKRDKIPALYADNWPLLPGSSCPNRPNHMMTSWNGNILCVTGHFCGEFTGHRWIPRTKASDSELWCYVLFYLRLNERLNKQSWGWWFETPSSSIWGHCNGKFGVLRLTKSNAELC